VLLLQPLQNFKGDLRLVSFDQEGRHLPEHHLKALDGLSYQIVTGVLVTDQHLGHNGGVFEGEQIYVEGDQVEIEVVNFVFEFDEDALLIHEVLAHD
jgi:hypothetical protein